MEILQNLPIKDYLVGAYICGFFFNGVVYVVIAGGKNIKMSLSKYAVLLVGSIFWPVIWSLALIRNFKESQV
jgi:hypothetical protein